MSDEKRSARDVIARVYDDATIATDGESAYVWADELLRELAAEGHTIVQLPEGENNWHVTDWDGGRVSLCYGVDTVRCYLPNPELEADQAENLGIALIAAGRSLAASLSADSKQVK